MHGVIAYTISYAVSCCSPFQHLWPPLTISTIFWYSLPLPVPLPPPPGSSVDTSRAVRRMRNTSHGCNLCLGWQGRREALAAPTAARHCSALIGICRSEDVCTCVRVLECVCGVGVWVGECGWLATSCLSMKSVQITFQNVSSAPHDWCLCRFLMNHEYGGWILVRFYSLFTNHFEECKSCYLICTSWPAITVGDD